jgi:hypothetical protein
LPASKKIESILHLLPDIPPFLYSISDFGTLLLSDEHKQNLTSIGLANNPMKRKSSSPSLSQIVLAVTSASDI